MQISSVFIKRPSMTTLVMLSFLLFGLVAYRALPVSELPNVDFPTIRVSASLPGANPETMASSVATPLEQEFSSIAGIDSMTSSNTLGSTQITLQFNLKRDIDAAAQDVQTAIAAATRHLPDDMTSAPSFRKVNPADAPVIFIALTSSPLPLSTVDEYAESLLAKRISMLSGVAEVNVFGAQKYAVRIRIDPRVLNARGIGIDEVASAVKSGNVNLPTGTLLGTYKSFTLQASGQLTSAEDYRPLIVTYKDGTPVRLGDVARVFDSVENDKTASWFNNSRAIVLAVQRQPGTNTVAVVQAVKDILPGFQDVTTNLQLKNPQVAMTIERDKAAAVLPSTITGNLQGTAQAFTSSMTGMGVLLLVAILVIYVVLGILYESFIHPLTILSGRPSAGLGALIRFRPIMMTTMAALMATLPIALGLGAGGESRQPLGLAVVGGLVFSQIVTLYITPVSYSYLDQLQRVVRQRFGRPEQAGTRA